MAETPGSRWLKNVSPAELAALVDTDQTDSDRVDEGTTGPADGEDGDCDE